MCPSIGIFPPQTTIVFEMVSSVVRGHVPGVFQRVNPYRLIRDLLGDKPDHCTERAFVCVCPTHVLYGPFLSPLTSQSVPWPVGAGRLNVMTPFFLGALWGPSIPLTFTQLSLRSQGYPHQLWSPTPAQKTQRYTHRENSSANAGTPLQDDSKQDDNPDLAFLRSWRVCAGLHR